MNVIEEIINIKRKLETQSTLIGEVKEFAGASIPVGWLSCDGSEYLKSDYPELYSVIGDLWGVTNPPSDSLHFRVPDKRHNVGVGYDPSDSAFDAIGKTGGEKTHTLTVAEMPSHNHSAYTPDNEMEKIYAKGSANYALAYRAGTSNPVVVNYTGGSGAHNNLQPYAVFNYIICAK